MITPNRQTIEELGSFFHYDPPYKTPQHDEFAWHLVKYLSSKASFDFEPTIKNKIGEARCDFMVWYANLDDLQATAFVFADVIDLVGAQIICAEKEVKQVIFIPWEALNDTSSVLFLVSKAVPFMFSQRGKRNLALLQNGSWEAMGEHPSWMIYEKGKTTITILYA